MFNKSLLQSQLFAFFQTTNPSLAIGAPILAQIIHDYFKEGQDILGNKPNNLSVSTLTAGILGLSASGNVAAVAASILNIAFVTYWTGITMSMTFLPPTGTSPVNYNLNPLSPTNWLSDLITLFSSPKMTHAQAAAEWATAIDDNVKSGQITGIFNYLGPAPVFPPLVFIGVLT